MCVLTFIPHSNGQVTVTHNRDEHFQRAAAIAPESYDLGHTTAVYPVDPQSGGTWFALHRDWICCMLNGAFEKHESKPPYRVSRGTVIGAFLQYLDINTFQNAFDPIGMEPFTFVAIDVKNNQLHQLIWDEHVFQYQNLPFGEAHIWSSSTLYNAEVKAARKRLFGQLISPKSTPAQVIEFHERFDLTNLGHSLFVNIDDKIHTVAITQVTGQYGGMKLLYKPFYQEEALFI